MIRTYVVFNDVQIPFQDQRALDMVVKFTNDIKPTGVVMNGDIVDCYAISHFTKDPMQQADIDTEIDQAGRLMKSLQKVKEKVWVGGNHEDRLRRFVWDKAPALSSQVQFAKMFNLKAYGFKWLDYGDIYRLGKLIVTHGSIVRQHSGWSARAHFEKYGKNVLIGHTHRLGTYYQTNLEGPHVAYENGCLCRLTPEYVQFPNWQQGFSVVHVAEDNTFTVQQIPILSSYFYYGSKRYS